MDFSSRRTIFSLIKRGTVPERAKRERRRYLFFNEGSRFEPQTSMKKRQLILDQKCPMSVTGLHLISGLVADGLSTQLL